MNAIRRAVVEKPAGLTPSDTQWTALASVGPR